MGSKTSLIKFNFSNRNTFTPLPFFPSSWHSPRDCAVLLLGAPLDYQRPPAAGDSHPDWSHIAPRLRHLHSDVTRCMLDTRQNRHYKNGISIYYPIPIPILHCTGTGKYMLYPVQQCLLRRKYLYNSNTCTIAFLCYHRQH